MNQTVTRTDWIRIASLLSCLVLAGGGTAVGVVTLLNGLKGGELVWDIFFAIFFGFIPAVVGAGLFCASLGPLRTTVTLPNRVPRSSPQQEHVNQADQVIEMHEAFNPTQSPTTQNTATNPKISPQQENIAQNQGSHSKAKSAFFPKKSDSIFDDINPNIPHSP